MPMRNRRLRQQKNRAPVTLRDVLQRAWANYEQHKGTPHEKISEDFPTHKRVRQNRYSEVANN
jgi:hypothetical protein